MGTKHATATLRETLSTTIEKELADLPTLLADLSPKERLGFVCKLLPYVMAKKEQTSIISDWRED